MPEQAPAPLTGSDAAIIARSARDPEAFAALYDRYAAVLHRYVTRRLGDGPADDVVADTFLDAFRNRHRFDLAAGDARPWLYGIAANHIGKRARSEVRMLRAYARTGTDPVLATNMEGAAEVALSRVSSQAVQRELAAAVAELPPGDRNVLLMVAWADLSYAEVAAALQIPVGTVRSRLHRARTRIRAALGGSDPTSISEKARRQEARQ